MGHGNVCKADDYINKTSAQIKHYLNDRNHES